MDSHGVSHGRIVIHNTSMFIPENNNELLVIQITGWVKKSNGSYITIRQVKNHFIVYSKLFLMPGAFVVCTLCVLYLDEQIKLPLSVCCEQRFLLMETNAAAPFRISFAPLLQS